MCLYLFASLGSLDVNSNYSPNRLLHRTAACGIIHECVNPRHDRCQRHRRKTYAIIRRSVKIFYVWGTFCARKPLKFSSLNSTGNQFAKRLIYCTEFRRRHGHWGSESDLFC
ncbi:conserved hypothetical protein [Trichinella spiralis]|nr:conserved hypothetical protein [Trichinella spiralis]